MNVLFFAVLILAAPGQNGGQAAQGTDGIDLAEAIDRAMASGSRTAIAHAAADGARAAAGTMSSAYLPRVSASGNLLRSEHGMTVTPIREPGVFPELDRTIYDLSLEVAWPVFDFGRGRAARKAARAAALAADIRYDLARMETTESVTVLYLRIAQLRERLTLEHQRIEALRRQQKDVSLIYSAGRVSRADVLRISEAVLSAETAAASTVNQLETALAMLTVEISASSPLRIDQIPPIQIPVAPPAEVYVDVRTVPLVAVAEAQVDGARAGAREASRSLLPAAEVFAGERLRSGSELDFDSDLSGGIRVRIPLFDGSLHTRRQVRRAEVTEREAALSRATREVRVAIDDLARTIQEARARADALALRGEYLEEAYRADRAAFEEGRLTLSDLLASEERLAAVRVEEVGVRAAGLIHHLQLQVLTGTLTRETAVQLIQGPS
jgi:outer membrane protein